NNRTPTLRDIEVALHRELIDHAGHGVARDFQLARKITARRQAAAGLERAVEDRLAQFVIELPRQGRLAARAQPDIDQAGQHLAHSTGLIILPEMDLCYRPVKSMLVQPDNTNNRRWTIPSPVAPRCFCLPPSSCPGV